MLINFLDIRISPFPVWLDLLLYAVILLFLLRDILKEKDLEKKPIAIIFLIILLLIFGINIYYKTN